MSVQIVLEETGFGLRAAVVEEDRLVELRDVDRDDERVTEARFAARVTAVDAKLNAAFLDVGQTRPGLLVAKDARAAVGIAERRPIKELVREGQRLVVQGLREAVEDKGGRFTADVKLLGFALVHTPLSLPQDAPVSGARRQHEALRRRGRALFPEEGMALRRHAANLGDEVLLAEAEQLRERWRELCEAARTARPGRLPEIDTPLERLLRGLAELEPTAVAVADRGLALELERLLRVRPAAPRLEIHRLDPDEPAFAQTNVDGELELALGRDVPLGQGARLVIEETAACVAIDVDGGGRPPLEVNLAAAAEIARQVRLRNLGGTIIVDFIDLPHKPERTRVEEALRKAFRHDPAPVDLHPMSGLGIVQISRARRGEPLAARFLEACAACAGSGRQASRRAAAERLLTSLRVARRPALEVRVAPDLPAYLTGPAGSAWRHTCALIGYTPTLKPDPGLAHGSFVLERR